MRKFNVSVKATYEVCAEVVSSESASEYPRDESPQALAAITAAVAEAMGADVSCIRIHSIKQI